MKHPNHIDLPSLMQAVFMNNGDGKRDGLRSMSGLHFLRSGVYGAITCIRTY